MRASGDHSWALVLAGGDGTRLQGLTRALTGAPIPKQYCRITGGRSLLEATLARLDALFPPARIHVVVNEDHVPLAAEQLGGLPGGNVLVQPKNRDTGPGLLWSLLRLARRAPRATVGVFPSDHFIRRDHAFVASVAQAIELVARLPDKIVLLGITPGHADPGLGYVELAAPLPGLAAFGVAAFVEKPRPEAAEEIIRRGGLWNSFVMVFRLDTMLGLLQQQRPLDYELVRRLDTAAYEALVPWNFSRDFLADIPEALVALKVDDVGWSDWGTPEAVERTLRALDLSPPWRSRASTAVGT
jgi:mannose-1-phosphate guanylyltransferase